MDMIYIMIFLISAIALLIGLVSPNWVLKFLNDDKRKRRYVLLIFGIPLIVSFALFGTGSDSTNDTATKEKIVEEKIVEEKVVEEKIVEEKITYEYSKVDIGEKEMTEMPLFDRYSIRAYTDEKLDKKQVEKLLKKIAKEIDYNKKRDQVFIHLSENKVVAERGVSLGKLTHKDGKTDINVYEKDWSTQPTDEEYRYYAIYYDKLYEYDDYSDEKVAEIIAEQEGTTSDIINESYQKVVMFSSSDMKDSK